jgi:ParB family chromosome partitioning protein
MRLLTLPDALKDGLLSGLITEGHARALAAIEDPKVMIEAYKIILRESASVRRAEDLARRMKAASAGSFEAILPTNPYNRSKMKIVSEEIDRIKNEIEKALGGPEKNVIKVTRSQRETRVLLIMKGDVIDTEERFQKVYQGICR